MSIRQPATVSHPMRTIRSFVRRSGRLTPPQQRALDELWSEYGIDASADIIDFVEVFRRDAPVVLEIGFGNGDTLVQQAATTPDQDFLGIEVYEAGIGHCLLKARDADLTNLKIVMHDAIEVLTQRIALHSLARLNLYFPDPWPKKRHHKRRIVNSDFLNLVADRLRQGGTLNIATDWANYAEHIDETLSDFSRFECLERSLHDGERPLDRPRTKFERRGLKKGHRIVDWRFGKRMP